MKTILVIASNSHSLLHYRQELLERFLERNLRVLVCAPPDSHTDDLVKAFTPLNIKVLPLKLQNTKANPFADFLSFYTLLTLIRSHKVDAVLGYHMKPVIYGTLAAKLLGIRDIYSTITGLGYVFTDATGIFRRLKQRLLRKLLMFSLSLNQRIFFQNTDDLELICTTPSLRKRATLVNGSGINIDQFPLTSPPQEISFLFVGRLLVHKGIEEYVTAARFLKPIYPHVSFKVAGGFHPNPAAISEETWAQWLEEGNIEYLGDVKRILPVLQASSVCVLPSYREGCPRSVLEALAVGRAVITTDAPGCRDTVIDQDNGYLVPVKNSQKLAEAMEKLIQTPSLIPVMGLKSRRLAQEKFDVHKVNNTILKGMGL